MKTRLIELNKLKPFLPLVVLSALFVRGYYFLTNTFSRFDLDGSLLLGKHVLAQYPDFFSYFFHIEGLVTLVLFILCGLFIKPRKWGIPLSVGTYILLLLLCTALWGGDYDAYKQHNHPTYSETIKSNDIEAEVSF